MVEQSVMDELRGRCADNATDKRVALVVQGGGMRGIYSIGALAALEDAELTRAFDIVVGSSAGAINSTYFLAGQANQAINAYAEDLSNRRFINPWRINKMVDIDYLIDAVLKKLYPINIEAVRTSPSLLEIILTDAESVEPVAVTNRDPELDIYEVLRATAALPALYNRKVQINGRSYVDGAAADGVPVAHAINLGATSVMAVLTRSPGFRRRETSAAYRLLGRTLSRGQSAALKARIGREDSRFNNAMDLLEGITNPEKPLRRCVVWPSDAATLVGRTTSDRGRLRACAEMGRADMQAALQQPWIEDLRTQTPEGIER